MAGCSALSRALVVNCSGRYNLGALKLADWLRQTHEVTYCNGDPGLFGLDYDLVCLSVVFSWHAPLARDIAIAVKDHAEVWAGGPGLFMLGVWWKRETGLDITKGLDPRFDKQRGDYLMTFASRGCPVNCYFCIVPRLEGLTFTLDWDFQPAPILCDNNISALPSEFQDHVVKRYRQAGVMLKDANSGFEPRAFTEETYLRWKDTLRGPWRFALDEMRELNEVLDMMRILKDVSPRKKLAWVLVGNEPIAQCHERAQKIIEHGGEPFCQYILPLTWLGDPRTLRPRHDWTYRLGKDFCRYYNRRIWRAAPIYEYSGRKDESPPFHFLRSKNGAVYNVA